jgi:enoyl-CoA hydratase
MNQGLIQTRKQERVGYIEINRPEKANAYNQEVLDELESALGRMEADQDVSVLVMSGAGERSFCAGADLDEMKLKDYSDALNLKSAKVFASIASYSKVTLAAINGAAVAGGLELALACDLRICSKNARFFFPETKLGLIPAAGGTHRLPQVVGIARAKELILGGRIWLANEAISYGLVSEVISPDKLMERAQQWSKEIGQRNQIALQLAKKSINFGTNYGLESSYEAVAEALLYQIKFKKDHINL